MQGKYILHNRPPWFKRQNNILTILRLGGLLTLIIATAIAVILAIRDQFEAAATIFVFSMGISGYLFNSTYSRQLQLNRNIDNALGLLRDRWDALRNDKDLLRLLCNENETEIDSSEKRLKLRLFLSTFVDIYILLVRNVRHGYVARDNEIELAAVYEEMLTSLFMYPYMIDVWRSSDKYGFGKLKNEYCGAILYVIDNIIEDVEREKNSHK